MLYLIKPQLKDQTYSCNVPKIVKFNLKKFHVNVLLIIITQHFQYPLDASEYIL